MPSNRSFSANRGVMTHWLTVMLLGACFSSNSCLGQTTTAQQLQASTTAGAQDAAELLKKLDQLIEQNSQLEKQNRELMEQIGPLRQTVASQAGARFEAKASAPQREARVVAASFQESEEPNPRDDEEQRNPPDREGKKPWGTYTPNLGFKLA